MSKLYQKIFAAGYDRFMSSAEKVLYKNRMELISSLEGRVLDVGVGTGVNFQFYHPEAEVIAVEPSEPMLKKALPKLLSDKNIRILNYGINAPEVAAEFAENKLDAIICTLVLCTIPNPELALQNFKKWLKPTGKLVVLEHIHSKKTVNAQIQNFINPAWKVIGDGCNLNRSTDDFIKSADFKMENEQYFMGGLQWYQGVFSV